MGSRAQILRMTVAGPLAGPLGGVVAVVAVVVVAQTGERVQRLVASA
jgi:hypothetical protein